MSDNNESFDTFYAAYPRKRARGSALKAWNSSKVAPFRPPLQKILDAIAIAWDRDWSFREKSMIPYPASWLRAHGWADEVELDPANVDYGEMMRTMMGWLEDQRKIELPSAYRHLERSRTSAHLARAFEKLTGKTYLEIVK